MKNLGQGGRDLKNQAMAFLEESKTGAPNSQLVAELEALRAKNQAMEEDINVLKMSASMSANRAEVSEFDNMDTEQLQVIHRRQNRHSPAGQ